MSLDAQDLERLRIAVRGLHEEIRFATGTLLRRAWDQGCPELVSRPGVWGAGDLGYALDEVAEAPLRAFVDGLAVGRPVTLVAEGPGVVRAGAGRPGAPLRVLVDPVDGTRSLMHDMRSAWALTGVAPDKGEATRLSDVQLAVQTELPTTLAATYRVLVAVRGRGATIARHDVATGEELDRRPLVPPGSLPLDNGYLAFTRYLPVERPLVAALEKAFLERAIDALGLRPRLLYDDQYLCSAGQLFLVATGRYRVLADLRATLRRRAGLENFTAKPYDLASLLVWTEAGVPVLDGEGAPLDAPLDTSTPLDVIAYGSAELREAYEPHLKAALEEVLPTWT